MNDEINPNSGQTGASWSQDASPPVILRENLQLECGDTTGMEFPDQGLSLWWNLYAATSATPEWAAFNPFKYPALLPHTMTYEKKEGRIRCGLVGETVREELPIKIAGSYLDEAMPATNLPDVTFRLEEAMRTGRPNFVVKTMAWQRGYASKRYCSLQLPFVGKNGETSRIMSVLCFNVADP